MSLSEEIFKNEAAFIAKTFNRQAVAWQRGSGCRLWDYEGRQALDFFSGHAVMNLGYGHMEQMQAMRAQLSELVHTGNLYYLKPQADLARALTEKTFGDRVMFSNSGAEIVELSIKLARKWGRRQGRDRFEIIVMNNSFHGRTFGALTATGQEKFHQGLEPLLPGFKYVSFNDYAGAEAAVNGHTAAILLEPVQGEGGVQPADSGYLEKIRNLCGQENLLLIFDEIQCGLGRLGRFNAYEYFGVVPDVMLLAKPLGGGLPISALVTRQDIASALQVGDHGSTFGGNPVAAAAGLVLLRELSQPDFLARVRKTGAYLGERLRALAAAYPEKVQKVRGMGLMWGMELAGKGPEAVRLALEKGLVINCTAGKVLRFLPALIIGEAEVDEAAGIMDQVLQLL